MLYLIQSGNYTKVGYADNIKKRINNYISLNPTIKLIGVKEGDMKDEYNYHLKYSKYIAIPKMEWMILPIDVLVELSREFNAPSDVLLSIDDKYKIKNKIIRIEKGLDTIESYDEAIPYEIAKKMLVETPVVSTRTKAHYSKKEVTPNNQVINMNKTIVQDRIRSYIKLPIHTEAVKEFLKELYKELGIEIYARATDVYNIWLPNEYKFALLTYNEIQAPYIVPINFKDKKSTSKRPLKVTFEDGTYKIFSSINEAAKILELDRNMLWYNVRKRKFNITNLCFELVD